MELGPVEAPRSLGALHPYCRPGDVVEAIAPESKVVYVDYDPLVLAHATALLTDTAEGFTDYLHADVRAPETIIAETRQRLDFTQPIGLMVLSILGHIPDGQAHAIMARLIDALPTGSYVAICEGSDIDPDHNASMAHYNETASVPYRPRSPADIAAFLDGLEMVEPGLVSCSQWRPETIEVGQARESGDCTVNGVTPRG